MKIKLMRILILFLIFVSIISINSFNTTATDEKYYLKSIIPYGYVPRNNLTMDPLYYTNENTNGTIYQNGSNPYVFRNHLLISDFEKIDSFFLKTISIGTLKDQFLWKAFSALYKENISYYYNDIYYLKRWTIFVIVANDTPPTYPQDGFFYSNRSNWQNFIGQGFWHINQPQKCIAIWMWRCSLCDNPFGQVQEVTDEITEVIRTTFPYYDLAYLEGNYYIYEYSKFSDNCIKNISIATDDKLTTEIEILNNNISQCMIRKAWLSIDLSNLFHISAPFYLKYSDFNFVDLIKNDLQENVDKAIEQNKKNLEILQETKNIIQNELTNRQSNSTLQIALWTLTIMIIVFLFDIIFNRWEIIEKLKWRYHTPKLEMHLKSYTSKKIQYSLTPTFNDGMEKYHLRVNNNPILGFEVRHAGKYYKYNLKTLEIAAPKECNIEYYEVFTIKGERPFIQKPYTDIWGNLKIFTDITIVKGQISDPTIFGFKLNYIFTKDEEKTISVKIVIDDCKKMFEKTFKIVGI